MFSVPTLAKKSGGIEKHIFIHIVLGIVVNIKTSFCEIRYPILLRNGVGCVNYFQPFTEGSVKQCQRTVSLCQKREQRTAKLLQIRLLPIHKRTQGVNRHGFWRSQDHTKRRTPSGYVIFLGVRCSLSMKTPIQRVNEKSVDAGRQSIITDGETPVFDVIQYVSRDAFCVGEHTLAVFN